GARRDRVLGTGLVEPPVSRPLSITEFEQRAQQYHGRGRRGRDRHFEAVQLLEWAGPLQEDAAHRAIRADDQVGHQSISLPVPSVLDARRRRYVDPARRELRVQERRNSGYELDPGRWLAIHEQGVYGEAVAV